MSMLTIMDLKAAPSDTLEHTLMLALARPAHYTEVCLKGSHTRSHLHGEFETCLALWQKHYVPHPWCETKRTCSHKKKHASPCLLSLEHCTTQPPTCFPPVPTMNLRNLQHARVFALHPSARSYLPPSQALSSRTILHTLLRPNTTLTTLHSAIKNDASPSKRRRRDRHINSWAKAERSRLDSSCRAFSFGTQAQSYRKSCHFLLTPAGR